LVMSALPGRIVDGARYARRALVVGGASCVGPLDQRLHVDRAKTNQSTELHVREVSAALEADDRADGRAEEFGYLVAIQERRRPPAIS
jgi:hypothetical protein